MSKKSVNWQLPEPVAARINEIVTDKFGGNAKWIGLCAAVLMYMEAGEEEIEKYERLASSMQVPGEARRWIDARRSPEPPPLRVAAKRATGQKSTAVRPPHSTPVRGGAKKKKP